MAQHLRLPAKTVLPQNASVRRSRCFDIDCAKYTIDGTRPTLEVSRELWLEWVQGVHEITQ